MDVAGGELVCLAGRHEFGEAADEVEPDLAETAAEIIDEFAQNARVVDRE